VIALPPLDDGGLKLTTAEAFPAMAEGLKGCVGTVAAAVGVTGFDGTDATLCPAEFTATPVKVYETPAASPFTVIGLEVPVPDPAGGVEVMM
jgi:hypothetical protein